MPLSPPGHQTITKAFALLMAAVEKGERCPTNDQIPGHSKALTTLARAGRIRIEVFDKNFRRITILDGLYAGRSTQDPPLAKKGHRLQPYLISDKAGTFRNGEAVERRAHPRPTMLFGKDGRRL